MGFDFSGVRKTPLKKTGGSFINPGRHIFMFSRIVNKKTRKKEEFIAIEMKCLKTLERGHNLAGEEQPGHLQGEACNQMLMEKHDMSLVNFKDMVMKVADVSEAEVTEEACEAILGEDQPLANFVVEVFAKNIMTTGSEKEITVVEYEGHCSRADLEEHGINPPEDAVCSDDLGDEDEDEDE